MALIENFFSFSQTLDPRTTKNIFSKTAIIIIYEPVQKGVRRLFFNLDLTKDITTVFFYWVCQETHALHLF